MTLIKRFLLLAVPIAAVLAGGTVLAVRALTMPAAEQQSSTTATAGPHVGGPFTLVNSAGQPVTDKAYAGKWLLVYFGYTYCPDVCPTTLNNIAQALAKLGPDAQKVTPIFITVDPKRDTPKVMGQYVKSFDPRIIGLTGSAAQIAAVAKEYHVYYSAEPDKGDGAYLVDHSSFVYLMTPRGILAKVMPGTTTGAEMATAISPLVDSAS